MIVTTDEFFRAIEQADENTLRICIGIVRDAICRVAQGLADERAMQKLIASDKSVVKNAFSVNLDTALKNELACLFMAVNGQRFELAAALEEAVRIMLLARSSAGEATT